MKVVVIGGRGMLGRALVEASQHRGHEVAGYDLPELDITKMDGREVEEGDWVVNCAAYTQVEQAEVEATKVVMVNACGAGNVAKMCQSNGWNFLQVSTDYVFDGRLDRDYDEEDMPWPLSVYGASKLLGESLVKRENPEALVVRTQSLFGDYGLNFVRSIRGQIDSGKKELRVVSDQVSCPTYVWHLALGMLDLMELRDRPVGVVNVSSEGSCSWYEFAEAIVEELGIGGIRVVPVKTGEFSVRAERPLWSVLSKARYMVLTGKEMPTWRAGLKEYLG